MTWTANRDESAMTRQLVAAHTDSRPLRRALALAVALGLAGTGLCGPTQAQGLVAGVLGTPVSPAPGQAASQRLRGGLALRLNQVELAGQTWYQLLASDGSHGWTHLPLGAEQPVTARSADRAFELMPLPPGHLDFLSSQGRPLPEGARGRLTGGSLESYVADMQDNQVPDWLSHSLAPWPRWAMGGVEGYAPLPALALSWPSALAVAGAALATPIAARDLLGQLGLNGLSQSSFLAPLAPVLHRLAPTAGARPGPIRRAGQSAKPAADARRLGRATGRLPRRGRKGGRSGGAVDLRSGQGTRAGAAGPRRCRHAGPCGR